MDKQPLHSRGFLAGGRQLPDSCKDSERDHQTPCIHSGQQPGGDQNTSGVGNELRRMPQLQALALTIR